MPGEKVPFVEGGDGVDQGTIIKKEKGKGQIKRKGLCRRVLRRQE